MPRLFDPLTIGTLHLKNRIVMPPMETGLASPAGEVTGDLIEHYVRRARGGVGLIITEHTFVAENGRYSSRQLGSYHDRLVPGLSQLAEAIHAEGVPVILQISHAGARATTETLGHQPVAPSAVPVPGVDAQPRPLAVDEIDRLVEAFGAAARRAKTAGFDGVEVHGAHGFLLNQFASPITNTRSDEFGGGIENRMRLPLLVIERVRAEVGDEFPAFYRLGASDMMPGGISVEDGEEMAMMLDRTGVAVIDVSGGLIGSRPRGAGPAYFVPLATAIKKVVKVPVIGVGKITTATLADDIIRTNRADLVAVGRAILTDPDWAEKALHSLLQRRPQSL